MALQYLWRLAAWLAGRRQPPRERSRPLDVILCAWEPPPQEPPLDPYSWVREPHHRRPGGLSTAVALIEPEPPESVLAMSGAAPRGSASSFSD